LLVTNRNSFPLPVGGVSGALSIAGVNVGNLSTGDLGLLAGGQQQRVQLPVAINFLNAASAANALRQGQGTVALTGQLRSGNAQLPIQVSDVLRFLR
jgi:LEA14-like dessication related protein